VTAFAELGGWTVVQAASSLEDVRAAIPGAVASSEEPIARYIAPPRPDAPSGPANWLGVLLPREALAPFLVAVRARIRLDLGDAVQVVPIKQLRARATSLVQSVDVPDGTSIDAVCITCPSAGRETLANECRALLDEACALGGKSYLLGTLPRDEAEWRVHLGETFDAVQRTKRMADPAGILGSVFPLR
jgi:hypothetical protein